MTLIKSSYAETASNGGKYSWLQSNSLESLMTLYVISLFFVLLAATIYYTAEWKYYCNNL